MSGLRLRGGPMWENNEVFLLGDRRVVLDEWVTLGEAIERFGPIRAVHRVQRGGRRETQEGDSRRGR